jgi:DtxR family Mn-dependent transcriptional regulator
LDVTYTPQRRFAPEGLTLSPAMEDYLKAIFHLGRSGESVTTQALADRMEVSPASVTKMLKRLAEVRLVKYEKYQGVHLTESGRRVAVEILRHHRLLELFLTRALGYTWDEVHDEAELLEHFISEKLEARIAELMGHPSFDPHGAPIPTLDGELPQSDHNRLADQDLYVPYEVTRVTDSDAEVLKELALLLIVPGITVTLLGRPPEGLYHLRVGRREVLCPPPLCSKVWTRPLQALRLTADQLICGERSVIHLLRGGQQREIAGLGIGPEKPLERTEKGFTSRGHGLALTDEQARSVIVTLQQD